MNKDIFSGKWLQLKGRLKITWAGLTDDDIIEVKGNVQYLAGKAKERNGREQYLAKKLKKKV